MASRAPSSEGASRYWFDGEDRQNLVQEAGQAPAGRQAQGQGAVVCLCAFSVPLVLLCPEALGLRQQKQNQQALDRSGDGTLRQGAGKRARKSQPWKRKQTKKAGESADELLQDAGPEHADEAAPTLVQKSRDEIISKTLAEKIRKRDEVSS